MRVLLYIAIALVVIAAATVGVGVLLKPEWRVERSAHIDAPPPPVFAFISLLGDWQEWTVWNKERYPGMETRVTGPQWGIGATLQWGGEEGGQLQVVDYQQDDYMEYQLTMDGGEFSLRSRLQITPEDSGSRLTWSAWGDAGSNPLHKLMMRVGTHFIGRDLDGGLKRLQARFKSQPQPAGAQPPVSTVPQEIGPETLPAPGNFDDGQTSQD